MDEEALRRILGEFAGGLMERFDRVDREICRIYATIEKGNEKTWQQFDDIEKRLDNIQVQLEYVNLFSACQVLSNNVFWSGNRRKMSKKLRILSD